jgi:hypothetical protein
LAAHARKLTGTAIAVTSAVLAAGCGSAERAAAPAQTPAPLPQGSEPVTIDPAAFTTDIDNPYLPLRPGNRWVYRESNPEGDRDKIVVTVSKRTKVVDGVRVRIVRDVDTNRKGRVVEDTRDWYAQDKDGNVWYFGEDTRSYEGGETSRAGSWTAGVRGALPGIAMPANPQAGQRYRQEYAKGRAQDDGEIVRTDERASAPSGRYRGVLVTRDTNALVANDVEYKFYARGVGQVLAVGVAGDPDREELISFHRGKG